MRQWSARLLTKALIAGLDVKFWNPGERMMFQNSREAVCIRP